MRTTRSLLPFLVLLPACATPTMVDGGGTETGARWSEEGPAADSGTAGATAITRGAPQDRDYSISGLFEQEHGEFVQNMQPYRENIRVNFMYQPDTELDNEAGDYDWGELGADIEYSFPIDPDFQLIVGGHADTRRYEFSSNFLGASGDENLSTFDLLLGAGGFVSDDLYIEGRFRPTIQSDLDGTLNSNDWDFFGNATATWQYSDDLFLKGGIEVDDTFDDLDAYPLLGMSWLFASEWRFDAMLPRYMEVSYNPSASWIIDAGLELNGAEYRVRTPAALGKQEFDWVTQEFMLYLGTTLRLNDNLSAFGQIGVDFAGDQDFRSPGGRSDGSQEAALFFEVGAGWSF